MGEPLWIDIVHLSKGSDFMVEYICDYCGKLNAKKYEAYNKSRKKIAKDCCGNHSCQRAKREESNLKFYGVENTLEREDVKKKIAETNIRKYGVDNPFKSDYFQKIATERILDEYGVENVFQSDEIKKKIVETNLERYGYEHNMQNPASQAKALKTKMERYGTQMMGSNIFVNGICASKAQVDLGKFLGGEVNKIIDDIYVVDIFISPSIIIEYDGGGHDLSVKLGQIRKEEFDKREEQREAHLTGLGYTILRVVNKKDKDFDYNIISDWVYSNKVDRKVHNIVISD